MDQGPETKRPRLSGAPPPSSSSWTGGTSHHGVDRGGPLPNPAPPPHAALHPTSQVYQASHPFHPRSEPPPPPPPQPPSNQHFDDRSNHEREPQYPPMQEHRQPPASPAHPPYGSYSREPMVKRDPSDDALPQLRRPHSTGNAQEPLPGTPHGPLPPGPHHGESRHLSFDGGPGQPPPPMYRAPSYPPPTPHSQHQHYDHGMYGPPPGADAIYPITYSSSSRKKAQRASQACDSCRSLKAKCDETKPCKNCREKGMECKYRDPIPKQQDKVAADILDGINLLRNELSAGLGRMDRRMNKFERALKESHPNVDLEPDPPQSVYDPSSPMPPGGDDGYSSAGDTPMGGEAAPVPMISPDEAQRTVRQMANDDEMDTEPPGPPVPPGEPAMPINHTTLAGLLLTWPAIKGGVQHLLEQEGIRYVEEYPIRQEEARGLLRLYGRGEGHDKRPMEGRDTQGDFGVIGQAAYSAGDNPDDVSDIASSPGENWGQTGGLSPPATVELKGTPLRANGDLDLEPDKVWQFVNSYEQNIQNMHPLIIPKELHAMVQVFLARVPTSSKRTGTIANIAKFINQAPIVPESPAEVGSKRKRSPAADVNDPLTQPQKPGKPYRNVDTALILMVLALGKICKDNNRKLPDVVAESENATHQSPQLRNGHPASPGQGSPPSYQTQSQSSGQPSPKVDDRSLPGARRHSFQGHNPLPPKSSFSMKRNLDNIPGLEYCAVATDIIGNHVGGKELKHVWVSILAGLYFGQLGRPIQSLEHIAMAGRTLQSLIRPYLDRYRKMKEQLIHMNRKRDNQLAFAFWTCLQLESDILAELQLPPSGILAYEQHLPYPDKKLAMAHGFSEDVLQSYFGQLYLRNHLNSIHKTLYDTRRTAPSEYNHPETKTIEILQESLEPIRRTLQRYEFDETDGPATDILAARLRAKYWGAKVITYRPFIRTVLDFNYNLRAQRYGPWTSERGDFLREYPLWQAAEMQAGRPVGDASAELIVEYARRGVQGLIQSTCAFQGLKERRFIITNVFGTAHAQWGNLIILDAVQRDPTLGPGLDANELRDMLNKTIDFFEIVAQPSSSLNHDMNILKGLRRQADSRRADWDRAASSSFSSATTGPPAATPGPAAPVMQAPATPTEPGYGLGHHQMSFAADLRRPPGEP